MSDNPNNLSPPTLDLLCHELKDVVEWDRLAISLKVPYVEVTSIQREYHDVQRCKLHALHKWLQQANNVHSWRTVASAVNDINSAVAERIKQKYAPIIDKVLEQSTSSPSPPPPPPSPPYNNHTKNNDSNGSNYTLEKKKWLTKKNAIRLLIISLLVGILVGIIACLIVLITRLRASDSALTSPMTITAAPIYMSATSMSSISVSYTNTIMKSSSLVTSSSITSSPSPTPSPISVPGSVQSLEVVPLSNNSVNVSWEPPQESIFVTQYSLIVQRWDGQGPTQSFTILVSQQLIQVVSSLDPYIPYTATVSATNDKGQGQPASKIFFTLENIPPVAPENLTVIRIDNTTLNVSWTPLSLVEAQGIILSYQLIYVLVGSNNTRGMQINASANASYILIGGLQVGKQYGVRIAAVTTPGVGKLSDFVYENENPSNNTGKIGGIAGGLSLLITVIFIDMLCFLQM